jgi:hypothetical protein
VTLSNAVDLTSLRFWGSSENYIVPGPHTVLGFTVRFYDGTFAAPALQFSVLRGSEITESYTGRLNTDGGKEYQFTVPVSGRLASGTWYMHVGAVLIDGADGDGWMWSGGKSPGMRFTTYDANWSAWTDDAVNSVAFELSGNVACPGDLDGSRIVDFGDVALTVLDFGPCAGCNSDIDGSGFVDFGDVALQLLDTGPCP